MPWFKTLLWIGTIVLVIVLGVKTYRLSSMDVATVECFEMANRVKAEKILNEWTQTGAIRVATNSIKIDFVFILFYVLLMINCSNHQMNLEPNLTLNNLLRLNIALAVDVDILDFAENLILLNNISSINDFFPTVVISVLKFVIAGWIVLVLLVSVLKKRMVRRQYA